MKRLSHKTWFRLAAVCFAALLIFAALFAGMSSSAKPGKSVVAAQPAAMALLDEAAPSRFRPEKSKGSETYAGKPGVLAGEAGD